MSCAALSLEATSVGGDDAALSQVLDLITDLEMFAFQSERVLHMLDLRAAAQARHVARRLGTIEPFVQLAIDDELKAAALVELAELKVQARICLGRSSERKDVRVEPTRETRSSMPPRRDPRREVTVEREVDAAGLVPAVAEILDHANRATEPKSPAAAVDSPPTGRVAMESGIRRSRADEGEVRDPFDDRVEEEDAAACRQWMSLLAK